MKRLIMLFAFVGLIGMAALFQQGCTIRFVTYGQATPTPIPFPNDYHIAQRIQGQESQIQQAVQAGNMDEWSGEALTENDDAVRQLAMAYRRHNGPDTDLSDNQTFLLDHMLDDNKLA